MTARLLAALSFLLAMAGSGHAQTVRVFPESPVEGEPFVIEVVATAPVSPASFLANSFYVVRTNIFLDLSITATGAATPASARFTKMVPGVAPGVYQLVVTVHPEGSTSATTTIISVPVSTRATPAQPAFRNLSGLWFNPDEAGWGVSILQGESGQLFALWFTYRPSDSAPTQGSEAFWLHMPAGIWASPIEFRGLLFETFGASAGKPFDYSGLTVNGAGSASFRFLSDHEVEFSAQAGTLASPFFQKKTVLRRFAF